MISRPGCKGAATSSRAKSLRGRMRGSTCAHVRARPLAIGAPITCTCAIGFSQIPACVSGGGAHEWVFGRVSVNCWVSERASG
eukprot:1509408-Alexandrium_andersonii.AAC.1